MRFFLLVFLILCLNACELTGKDTGANLGIENHTHDLMTPEGTLKGTGQIVFPESLGQVRGAKSFHLRFFLEDHGSLTFYSYSDQKLEQGLGIEFGRHGNSLEVTFFSAGVEKTILKPFESINAAGWIELMIDVHNNHDDAAHLFLWSYTSDNNSDYEPGNALINTDYFKLPDILDGFDFPEWHDLAIKGHGAFWGLDLLDAEVSQFRVGPPRDNS